MPSPAMSSGSPTRSAFSNGRDSIHFLETTRCSESPLEKRRILPETAKLP